jgi:hypothetical protein
VSDTQNDNADDNVDDTPDQAAIEAEARKMGWVPEDRFVPKNGRKWVDAATFVQRGHEVLPIIQANNRKLQETVDLLRVSLEEATKGNKELRESIGALEEFHNENLKVQVEAVRANLKEQLKAAKKDGDVDAEVELTDKLSRLNEDEKAADKAKKKADEPPPKKDDKQQDLPDHAFDAWRVRPENAWFGKDTRKTALAVQIGRELGRDRPELILANGMPSPEFYDTVAAEVAEFLGEKTKAADKVSSSRTTRSGSGGSGKTFADLPPDAKEACAKLADKVVGPNKAHKDMKSWEAAYAKTYYATVA